jgi:hypothetical protein
LVAPFGWPGPGVAVESVAVMLKPDQGEVNTGSFWELVIFERQI